MPRDKLWCSRILPFKRQAELAATIMRRHGGTRVSIIGKRGGPYRVRGLMSIEGLAKFASIEARRESLQ